MTTNEDRVREAFAAGERAYLYRVPRERAVLGRPDPTGELRTAFLAGYDDAVSRRARY
jgi:hypothetical protein